MSGQIGVVQEVLLILFLTLGNLFEHAYAVPVARPHALHSLPFLGVSEVPCADDGVHGPSLFVGRRSCLATLLLHYQTVLLA